MFQPVENARDPHHGTGKFERPIAEAYERSVLSHRVLYLRPERIQHGQGISIGTDDAWYGRAVRVDRGS